MIFLSNKEKLWEGSNHDWYPQSIKSLSTLNLWSFCKVFFVVYENKLIRFLWVAPLSINFVLVRGTGEWTKRKALHKQMNCCLELFKGPAWFNDMKNISSMRWAFHWRFQRYFWHHPSLYSLQRYRGTWLLSLLPFSSPPSQ